MKCYCISGLGADKRVFEYVDIGLELIHIEWLKPNKRESLFSYSKRLSEQIDSSKPFILLGLSFGGIIACEISKILTPKMTILISSISTKQKLPKLYTTIGLTRAYRLVPSFLYKAVTPLTYWLFGVNNKKEKKLLKAIIKSSDTKLAKWSVEKILNKEKITPPNNLIHIHGTNDRLLPCTNTTNVYLIEDGGHFMIYQKYNLINQQIIDKLRRT